MTTHVLDTTHGRLSHGRVASLRSPGPRASSGRFDLFLSASITTPSHIKAYAVCDVCWVHESNMLSRAGASALEWHMMNDRAKTKSTHAHSLSICLSFSVCPGIRSHSPETLITQGGKHHWWNRIICEIHKYASAHTEADKWIVCDWPRWTCFRISFGRVASLRRGVINHMFVCPELCMVSKVGVELLAYTHVWWWIRY